MWQIISEKDKKKYALLDALYRKYDPITIQSLSACSGLSQRSVLNYLDELKLDLALLQGEILSSNEGIRMHLPSHIGLDHFKRKLIKESTGFQILEYLFFQGDVPFSHLEEKFFLSTSSLDRMLKRLRKALEPYHIGLSGSPVSITGQEFFVRRFYIRYFIEAYPSSDWPFENLQKETLQHLLHKFPPYCLEYKGFIKTQELLYQFAVSLTRTEKGFTHPKYPVSSFTEKKITALQEASLQKLQGEALGCLSLDAVSQELSLMKLQYTTDVYKERMHKDPDFQSSMRDLLALSTEISDLFKLTLPASWPSLIELYQLLRLYTKGQGQKIPTRHLLFQSRDFTTVKHHRVEYPFFYSYVIHSFRNLLTNRGLKATESILEELYYTFLSHSDNLTNQLFTNFRTCKVLLYSHLSFSHAKAVEEILIANFNRMIQVEIFQEAELNRNSLDKYSFDLLLTTETVEVDTAHEVLYLHFHENGYQVTSIYKAIRTVVEKKKENQTERIRRHMVENKKPFQESFQ